MNTSVDFNNPIYDKMQDPRFDRDNFTDIYHDDAQSPFIMHLGYEYYEHNGEKRIVSLIYTALGDSYYMTDESMRDSIVSAIELRECAYIRLECKIEKFEAGKTKVWWL